MVDVGYWPGKVFSLYEEILIPEAVYQEVVTDGMGRPGSASVRKFCEDGKIQTKQIANEKLYRALVRALARGEAEVLTLALEKKHDLILLDEHEARKTASMYRRSCLSAVGVTGCWFGHV